MRVRGFLCLALYGAVGSALAQNIHSTPPGPLYAVCENNLRTKLWAQIFVDADLANAEASRLTLPYDQVRIAVLDTGFDSVGNGKRLATKQLEVLKGHKDAADPVKDVDGHGTAVSGVIAGEGGLGIAPEARLSVYRVTTDDSGSCSSANLRASIRKACDDGNSIINVSWGGNADETGENRDEKADAELIAYAAKKGCLIVKAAGNSSYRKQYATNDLDDAYLRVAGVTGAGELSPFSSAGEVQAPGSFVYTLRSNLESGAPPNAKSCSKSYGQFINGTSFSAPITAAVAVRTLAVFQQLGAKAYDAMTPPEKIRLLNRTLKASERRGSISVLRSMLIAERWTQHPTPAPTVAELAALLVNEPPPFCTHALPKYDEKDPAPYVAAVRRRFAACEGTADPASILILVNQLTRGHNLEPALRWIAALDEAFLTKELSKAKPVADYLWHFLQKKWSIQDASHAMKYEIDFDEALTFLPFYVATRERSSDGRQQITAAIHTFLDSWDFEQRMSRRTERGSEADAAALQKLWRLVASKAGTSLPLQLVKAWITPLFTEKYGTAKGRKLLAGLRLIDGLSTDSTFRSEKKAIDTLEWTLFEQSNQTNKLDLEKNADAKPNLIYLSVWGSDIQHYDVRYLDGFIERHGDKVRKLLGLDGGTLTPGKLSSFFLRYFLAGAPTLPNSDRVEIALATLKAIAMRQGWNNTKEEFSFNVIHEDKALAELALQSLKMSYTALGNDVEGKTALKARYQAIFRSATSFEFYASQVYAHFSEWQANEYLLKWAEEQNPFLTKDLLYEAAVRVFRVVPRLRKSVRMAETGAIGEAISALTMYLRFQPHAVEQAVAKLAVPPLLWPALEDYSDLPEFQDILDPHGNRLEPAKYPPLPAGNRSYPSLLAATMVQSWAEFLLTLSEKEREQLWLERPIKAVMDRRFLCESLPPTGPWRAPVAELQRLTQNSYSYFRYGNFDMMWTAKRLLERCK